MRPAEIDHRLDGEEHAGLEHDTLTRPPDMHDIRLVMEQPANAVAAKISHHAHVLGFHESLDRVTDIAGGPAWPDRGDAAHHAFIGDLDQPLGAARNFTDRIHAAGIAVPLVENQGDVDVDDVALAQRLVARNAMADHMVDRGAGRLAIAAIHQGRRQRATVHAEFEYHAVDVFRRHARFDFTDQHV